MESPTPGQRHLCQTGFSIGDARPLPAEWPGNLDLNRSDARSSRAGKVNGHAHLWAGRQFS